MLVKVYLMETVTSTEWAKTLMKQEEQEREGIKQMSSWDIRYFCDHGIHLCECPRKIMDVTLLQNCTDQ